ncbi:hypothetical protein N0O92_22195 [Alkalihalobacillus sp. MEB130]|uniref:hypothetical protein n=1 Tax=Alkalihalobacillus sp. MEB130 TaxID=2976704 RepID=UPI0028DDAB99|nr:hypothetical protein [Alkalihalobacillus sp. MEB130]MDT8862888.1 hypothetical protein [Alkalihalobacillus sp. MEB130]
MMTVLNKMSEIDHNDELKKRKTAKVIVEELKDKGIEVELCKRDKVAQLLH